MLAHPTLNRSLKLLKQRRELTDLEPMRANRHTKAFERKRPCSKTCFTGDLLPQAITNPSKINGGFGRINLQARNLPKNPQLTKKSKDGLFVSSSKQENIICKSEMIDTKRHTADENRSLAAETLP